MPAICPGDGNKYIAGSGGNFAVIVCYCWLAGNITFYCLPYCSHIAEFKRKLLDIAGILTLTLFLL